MLKSSKEITGNYMNLGIFLKLFAICFQHEIDHLDGILFIDKAKNIVEIPPSKPAS